MCIPKQPGYTAAKAGQSEAAIVPSHQYYLKQGFKPEHRNLSKDRPASEHGQKSPDRGTLAWTSRLSQHRVLTSIYAHPS